jgi:hypothetical protein
MPKRIRAEEIRPPERKPPPVKKKEISDETFLALWETHRSAIKLAQITGLSERRVHARRRELESKFGVELTSPDKRSPSYQVTVPQDRVRTIADVVDAHVLVMSDAHYLPGEKSLAHRAFVAMCKELKPKLVIANGDILDLAGLSRHDPIGFEEQPTVKSELEVLQERLAEIEDACKGVGTIFLRTIGNHDLRFERYLAMHAASYKGVAGFRLADHIPRWSESWSVLINDTCMVRHRPVTGGIHSAYNSTLKAGISYVHGHLHRLCVTPWADYTGIRWGVDTGTLARLDSRAFLYLEDAPTPWSSGFAVLSFDHHGRLLPPELCQIMGEDAIFRGRVILQGEDENRGAETRRPRTRRAA